MINWPLAADYSMMLQNPQVAFKATELRQATIARDRHNQPLGLSGAFAVVYHATLPSGRDLAIRAFTSPNSERAQRYDTIAAHLRKHRKANYLVEFEYFEKGIRAADGKFYPLLTMEWVAGDTLYDWVDKQCFKRNTKQMLAITDKWVELIDYLEAARIAHGDLQHGNILVSKERDLKLVDYDCMCVPSLVGRRNLEIGVEPYQHPDRNGDTPLTLDLDRFSAIVIFVALRALAADPALWREFVVQDTYDNLLFRRSDFENPGGSRLRQALAHSPDTEVPQLFDNLTQLFRADIRAVPSLREFLFSFDTVRNLLSHRQYDEAVELVFRFGKSSDIPAALRGPFSDAQRRVACRKLIAKHVEAGDEKAMARDYRPALLADFPAASKVADVARQAREVVGILDQLDHARRSRDVRNMVRIWDRHAPLLGSRKSGEKLKVEVNDWRRRNLLCDRVLPILVANNGDDNLGPLWQELRACGGHPELTQKSRAIDRLVKRWNSWQIFQRVPREISADADRQRVATWQEPLFAGWAPAEHRRSEVETAGQRLDAIEKIEDVAAKVLSLSNEQQIDALAKKLPNGYASQVKNRTSLAASRLSAIEQLERVLKTDSQEALIAEAWMELQRLGCQTLLQSGLKARLDLATRRAPLIAKLKQIPQAGPSRSRDHSILEIWDSALLDDCAEAAPWASQYREAVVRRNCLQRLEQAINAGDDEQALRWSGDPHLANYDIPVRFQQPVQDAATRLRNAERLCEALRTDNRNTWRADFDARLIRKFKDRFAPLRERLVACTREELLSPRIIGLKEAVVTNSVVPLNSSITDYRLRWSWPKPHFTDFCIIGLTYGRPEDGVDPRELKLPFRDLVYRKNYESAGGCRIIHPDAAYSKCQVFVWAIVDLGFVELASKPLFLGRLDGAK